MNDDYLKVLNFVILCLSIAGCLCSTIIRRESCITEEQKSEYYITFDVRVTPFILFVTLIGLELFVMKLF